MIFEVSVPNTYPASSRLSRLEDQIHQISLSKIQLSVLLDDHKSYRSYCGQTFRLVFSHRFQAGTPFQMKRESGQFLARLGTPGRQA